MIDLEKLAIEDFDYIEKLQQFRKKAQELYYIVLKNQKAPLVLDENNRFTIWSDAYNAEYLACINNEWVWQARYLHQSYDVPVNPDKIYKIMVRGYLQEKDETKKGYVNDYNKSIGYFEAYVMRMKDRRKK